MSNSKKFSVYDIAVIGVLVALEIILKSYFQVSLWNLKFGFAFLPVAIAARRYGLVHSVIISALGDVTGALLVPTGPFFPGFTLTACLTGLCCALFIHKKCNIVRIVSYVLINQIFGTLLLNTYWIHIVYGAPFVKLLITRSVEAASMAALEIILLSLIFTKADYIVTHKFTK